MSRRSWSPFGTLVITLGVLLIASCGGTSGGTTPKSEQPSSVPPGSRVSDTAYWRFAYPSDWTTDESTGDRGEHKLNVRGPQVTPTGRCFGFAVWEDNYTQDLVKATRALLVMGGPDQQVITDETFSTTGARQSLRIDRIYAGRTPDGSTVRLHAYELHFLRDDNVAIGFNLTVPADHVAECHVDQILQTFAMKPPPKG